MTAEISDDFELVVFSDRDIEDIQSVCQDHPFLKDVLEEFVDDLLELRSAEAA